eukprot:TRINITY_DN3806_c0_g1_i5.p5 TRINITY_DN3806_c0_g1~~TRINITY_DN3806_c0_g1_i5.p5  ORF type:complete len:146 (+),score=13.78 TRINITY_DN3806_c0_g1_i5:1196-1633(+)
MNFQELSIQFKRFYFQKMILYKQQSDLVKKIFFVKKRVVFKSFVANVSEKKKWRCVTGLVSHQSKGTGLIKKKKKKKNKKKKKKKIKKKKKKKQKKKKKKTNTKRAWFLINQQILLINKLIIVTIIIVTLYLYFRYIFCIDCPEN